MTLAELEDILRTEIVEIYKGVAPGFTYDFRMLSGHDPCLLNFYHFAEQFEDDLEDVDLVEYFTKLRISIRAVQNFDESIDVEDDRIYETACRHQIEAMLDFLKFEATLVKKLDGPRLEPDEDMDWLC